MAQDLKRSSGVIKVMSHFGRGATLDKIGSQGLVHAVFGVGGFEKKPTAIA
jgi:hypothetical protein